MKYELAKKLKDAGFPQGIDSTRLNYPTLSELIDACGESFYKLQRTQGKSLFTWGAFSIGEFWVANTPEEAVAELWIALKNKK